MTDNNLDYLIPELHKKLTESFSNILAGYPIFQGTLDTSPLLNMTIGVYLSSLLGILDVIRNNTIGETRLIENIKLAEETILNAIRSLPFVKSVEEM